MAAPLKNNIKEKILVTTTTLMQNKSFNDISLAGIARAAEISKGTLYYYYNNKEDILFDITDNYLSKLSDDFISWVENKNKDTSIPRLIRYVLERSSAKDFGSLRLYLAGAAVSGNDTLRQKYIERYHYFKDTIRDKIIERCPDSDGDYIAWLLLTTMDGILLQKQLENTEFNSKEFIEKTVLLITK